MSSTSLCPFEWRYSSKDMRRVFSEINRFNTMVKVELALLRGLAKAGVIPEDAVKCLEGGLEFTEDDVRRVRQVESKVKHEVAALVKVLSEMLGDAGRFVHLGATSNDIIDTTWSLLLREALEIVESKLIRLILAILGVADRHIDTLMVGRTHGQHALPLTLGFKFMNYAYELAQCLERLMESHKRLFVLKMSGAVGTMAAWGKKGLLVERLVAEELRLKPVEISTQVYSRDRFAELICNLAILGAVLDRLACEIRNLQRPEIMELAEPSGTEQVGSSTMPHKVNPILCEKVSGLARFLRGLASSAIENIVLWHERDLSNSSYERIVLPHVFLTIDEMLNAMLKVISGLRVYPSKMLGNLVLSKGRIMAEALVVKLTLKGMPRQKAYEHVRMLVSKSLREDRMLKDVALEDKLVRGILDVNEITSTFNYREYLGSLREIYSRTKDYVLSIINSCSKYWSR